MMVKNFLIKAGMNLDDPRKQVFFNDRNGILLVRATSNELDLIESLLINIKSNPSQSSLTADKGSEVKFLGLTLVDPTVKLMKQYGLPKDSRLPLIIEVNDPSFFPEGMKPSKGCAFWIVENPANGFLFLNEKTPDYRPKNIKELAEAIVACTVSPEEYQKIYDRMAVAARASVSNFKDNPKEQERILKIAESKVPAEEVGKYICRVVYNYPNNAGTMTTWIRMTRADLDQVRELAKK